MPSYSQYKRQMTVLDADDIQWITVKGNHIPIKEGQSKEDAVKSFFESKEKNKESGLLGERYDRIHGTQPEKSNAPLLGNREVKNVTQQPTNKEQSSNKSNNTANKTIRGKTRFGNHIGKLFTAIGSVETPKSIIVNTQGGSDKKFDWNSVKEAIKYAESVDDVTGIKVLGKNDEKLGWFGIEPANSDGDIFDVLYDYTDNDFGDKVFEKLKNPDKKESKYDPEFEVVRKNALANSNVYGGKYTQKSKAEAYKEYKNDTSSKENMKKANEFVNGKPESSKKWSESWKPSAKQKQEAGFRLLEIGYNDVDFGKDTAKNKQNVLNAIKESGTENADYLTNIVKNMPDNSFSDVEKFRTSVKNAKKDFSEGSNVSKSENKEQMPTSYQIEEAFREVGLKHKWEHVKYRLDMHGIDQYTVKEFINSGLFHPEDIIEALESPRHDKIDAMVKKIKKGK